MTRRLLHTRVLLCPCQHDVGSACALPFHSTKAASLQADSPHPLACPKAARPWCRAMQQYPTVCNMRKNLFLVTQQRGRFARLETSMLDRVAPWRGPEHITQRFAACSRPTSLCRIRAAVLAEMNREPQNSMLPESDEQGPADGSGKPRPGTLLDATVEHASEVLCPEVLGV